MRWKQISCLLLLILCHLCIYAQKNPKITGKVLDDKSLPVPSVTVKVVKDTDTTQQSKVLTDSNGVFLFPKLQPNERYSLTFSSIGFETQYLKNVPVSEEGNSSIVIRLEASENTRLNDVVVVGYGTQKKVNLTGAVSVIDGKALQNRPVNNVSQALYGNTPGLTIGYGNNGFEPGAGPSVQILSLIHI